MKLIDADRFWEEFNLFVGEPKDNTMKYMKKLCEEILENQPTYEGQTEERDRG